MVKMKKMVNFFAQFCVYNFYCSYLYILGGDADLEEIGDVAAAASLLKMFLRELSEPVIPEDLQPLFISVQDKYCKDKPKAVPLFKELINRMPALNSCLLKYLCEFMLCIASVSDVNKMTPLALAIVFGPNLFRCGDGLNGLRDQAYVNAVLLLMLQEFHELFLVCILYGLFVLKYFIHNYLFYSCHYYVLCVFY